MSISETRTPPCEPAGLEQETHHLPTIAKRNNFVKAAQFFKVSFSQAVLTQVCPCLCVCVRACV